MDNDLINALKQVIKDEITPVKNEIASIKDEINTINAKLDKMDTKIDRIEKRVNATFEQTAALSEFQVETNDKLHTSFRNRGICPLGDYCYIDLQTYPRSYD